MLKTKNKSWENSSLNSRKQEILLFYSIASHLQRSFKGHRNRYETRHLRATELSSLNLLYMLSLKWFITLYLLMSRCCDAQEPLLQPHQKQGDLTYNHVEQNASFWRCIIWYECMDIGNRFCSVKKPTVNCWWCDRHYFVAISVLRRKDSMKWTK